MGMPPTAASAARITVDFTDATHSKATARRAAIWLKRWATRAKITIGLIGKLDESGNWLGGAKSQRPAGQLGIAAADEPEDAEPD